MSGWKRNTHTDGPWKYDGGRAVEAPSWGTICSLKGPRGELGLCYLGERALEQRANGDLIAEAPALLAAAADFLRRYDNVIRDDNIGDECIELRASIARARGE